MIDKSHLAEKIALKAEEEEEEEEAKTMIGLL